MRIPLQGVVPGRDRLGLNLQSQDIVPHLGDPPDDLLSEGPDLHPCDTVRFTCVCSDYSLLEGTGLSPMSPRVSSLCSI